MIGQSKAGLIIPILQGRKLSLAQGKWLVTGQRARIPGSVELLVCSPPKQKG